VAPGKRTIVRVQTHSLSVIRPAGSAVDCWCEECAAIVPMVTPEYAAQLCSTTTRAMYQRIENGELHFTETGQGDLFVCAHSLQRELNRRIGQ
jgi:hypothetical protein